MIPKTVLCVCLGNICRSPSAEAVLRQKCQAAGLQIEFDSAGTSAFHLDEAPDERAINVGKKLGYALESLRARQVTQADFYRFDVIFAMDEKNLKDLKALHARAVLYADAQKVAQLRLFDPSGVAVADPYFGDVHDFEKMYVHLQAVADGWVAAWS